MLGIPIVDAAYGPRGRRLSAGGDRLPFGRCCCRSQPSSSRPTARRPQPARRAAVPRCRACCATRWWCRSCSPSSGASPGSTCPDPLHRFLGLIGAAGPPLALFCLGATLPRPTRLVGLCARCRWRRCSSWWRCRRWWPCSPIWPACTGSPFRWWCSPPRCPPAPTPFCSPAASRP